MEKTAFLFPGQGAQYIGMSKKMCEIFPDARRTFEEADDALGFNLQRMCFEGDAGELTKTENAQPAILTASVAAYRAFMREIGVKPSYGAGHSLGEISALCCCGAIAFADAVVLVKKRGKFMQEAVPEGMGAMTAIMGISPEEIQKACKAVSEKGEIVTISNYNSQRQTVISGSTHAVEEAAKALEEKGAAAVPLKVSAPFHSPLMQPAADMFGKELAKCAFGDFDWPVISNVTAMPYKNSGDIPQYLEKQIVSPVRWLESMQYIQNNGVTFAVEMGPKKVLKDLLKNSPIKVLSFDVETDMEAVKSKFSKEPKTSADGMGLLTKCIAEAVCTKNRNFNNDEYETGVVAPYRELTAMKEEIVSESYEPSVDQMKKAVNLLHTIFTAKKVPKTEQDERFAEVFSTTGTENLKLLQ